MDIIKEILEPTVEKKVEEEKYVVKHPEAVAVVEITTPADNGDGVLNSYSHDYFVCVFMSFICRLFSVFKELKHTFIVT